MSDEQVDQDEIPAGIYDYDPLYLDGDRKSKDESMNPLIVVRLMWVFLILLLGITFWMASSGSVVINTKEPLIEGNFNKTIYSGNEVNIKDDYFVIILFTRDSDYPEDWPNKFNPECHDNQCVIRFKTLENSSVFIPEQKFEYQMVGTTESDTAKVSINQSKREVKNDSYLICGILFFVEIVLGVIGIAIYWDKYNPNE